MKIHSQENPSIGRNVLEVFCVFLYTEFLPDSNEKIFKWDPRMTQMQNAKFEDSAATRFLIMLITHTHIHTDTDIQDTHTHRPNAKNVIFVFKRPQNMQIYQNIHF